METYSQIRARHIAAWGEAFGDRLARLRWSRAQIDAERDRALRALVHTARSGSAWHAPRLAHVVLRHRGERRQVSGGQPIDIEVHEPWGVPR